MTSAMALTARSAFRSPRAETDSSLDVTACHRDYVEGETAAKGEATAKGEKAAKTAISRSLQHNGSSKMPIAMISESIPNGGRHWYYFLTNRSRFSCHFQ